MSAAVVHHIDGVAVRYHLVFPHPTAAKFLVVKDGDKLSLPTIEPQEHHTAVVAEIGTLTAAKYGLPAVAVRILCYQNRPDEKAHFRLYQLVNWQEIAAAPAGCQWLSEADLPLLQLPSPAYLQPLRTWFTERSGRQPLPDKRVPWALPGWYPRICAWIGRELAGHGYRVKRIDLYRAWGISAGLWVETDRGRIYVKVAPPQFRREPALTAFMAQQEPALFARVIAIEPEKGWLMMAAEESSALLQCADVETWERALRLFGSWQRRSREFREAFLQLGCDERPMAAIPALAKELFGDERLLRPEPGVALKDAEIERLRAALPQIEARCRHYGTVGLRPVLGHGDFHPGNILVVSGRPLFIDWSDASWTHPFFDIAIFLLEDFGNPPAVNEQLDRLIATYLAAWTEERSLEALRAEFAALRPLATLFHALTYAHIVNNFEESARWEMHNVVPWMLRQFLQGWVASEP